VTPPVFYRAQDAREALIRMMVELDFEQLTCAACGRATATTPAVVHRKHDCVGYVLCRRCLRFASKRQAATWKPGDSLENALEDADPAVGARVDKRLESSDVIWLEPLPPIPGDEDDARDA
jgi:hypothetical protein